MTHEAEKRCVIHNGWIRVACSVSVRECCEKRAILLDYAEIKPMRERLTRD